MTGPRILILPITSPNELVPLMNGLRLQHQQSQRNIDIRANLTERGKSVIATCVQGQPLSEHQANTLIEFSPSLGELMQDLNESDQQRQRLTEVLGEKDAQRMLLCMSNGPQIHDGY